MTTIRLTISLKARQEAIEQFERVRKALEEQHLKIEQDAAQIADFHRKARMTIKVSNRMSTYEEHEVVRSNTRD